MLEPDRNGQPRKELAEALRALRKAANLSGERLAVRCAMSQAKISRIETGKTLPSVVDVERILAALDVPAEVTRELVTLTRRANIDYRSWRTYAQVGLWRAQAEIKALAESSTVVRQFLPAIPSGLLQTEEYARQVLTSHVPGDISLDVDKTVAARMASQEVLRDTSRRFVFLMTESAVRWHRVDRAVLAEQCRHMSEVASRPNVEIAVIQEARPVHASPLHVFGLYDERLVTVELFSGEIALRDPKDVAFYLDLFTFFLDHAVTGPDAYALLRSTAEELMRERD